VPRARAMRPPVAPGGPRRAAVAVALLGLIAMGGAPAVASPGGLGPHPDDLLQRGRVCYEALDFICAERELTAARERIVLVDDVATRVEILQLAAEVTLALDKRAEAVDLLAELLVLAPDFRPPEAAWPATWREALAEARTRTPDGEPPEVRGELPPTARADEALEISVWAADPSGVVRVVLYIARDHTEAPAAFAMASADGEVWRAIVPRELVRPPALALWVEAWDRLGHGPGRWGSEGQPWTIPVTLAPAPATPVWGRWWFWTAVGAVVVGGVVLAVALSGEGEVPTPGSPVGDARVILELP